MNALLQTVGLAKRPDIPAERPEPGAEPKPATLLVIQADAYDWPAIFAGCRLRDGRPIRVIQAGWDQLVVTADSPAMSATTPALVHLRPKADGKGGGTVKPDYLLIRNEVRGGTYTEDWRGALFGLMFAGIPSVNSLESIYSFLERPIVQAELNKTQRRLGIERFPVIAQSYFAQVRKTPSWPRSWANFSPFTAAFPQECMGQLPNLHLLGQPNTFLATAQRHDVRRRLPGRVESRARARRDGQDAGRKPS
jgi:hypothetical protein